MTAMRRRTARTGRGMTTSPARSPTASDPGRASRSSATATAIVVRIPRATSWTTSPSAPQSHWFTPSATTTATPQPIAPASRAETQPRRLPSNRRDRLVVTTARRRPTSTRATAPRTAAMPSVLPAAGRRVDAAEREAGAALDGVDQRRAGLEAERGVERDHRRRPDLVVEREAIRHTRPVGDVGARGEQVGRESLGTFETPPRQLVRRHLDRLVQVTAPRAAEPYFDGVVASHVRVEPEAAVTALDRHPARAPARG